MGLMPAGAGNPFTKLDVQGVIGALKSTGSQDADVLYAQKQQLLAPASHLKLLGMILMGGGALLTITVIAAILGIPLAIFGWFCWSFGKKNIAAVETGYLTSIGMSMLSRPGWWRRIFPPPVQQSKCSSFEPASIIVAFPDRNTMVNDPIALPVVA